MSMVMPIVHILRRLEEGFLAALLLAMILLACLQIFLRLFFDSGLIWIDPLLRHLVVWGGFFGAVLAVSKNKHISLDISQFLLPAGYAVWLKVAGRVSGFFVCAVLTYASCIFLQSEIEFGGGDFLLLPSWAWNLVFPLAFGAMSLRFLLSAFSPRSAEAAVIARDRFDEPA